MASSFWMLMARVDKLVVLWPVGNWKTKRFNTIG